MTSEAYPIHDHVSSLQKMTRAVRGLLARMTSIDLCYEDPWERKRSKSPFIH